MYDRTEESSLHPDGDRTMPRLNALLKTTGWVSRKVPRAGAGARAGTEAKAYSLTRLLVTRRKEVAQRVLGLQLLVAGLGDASAVDGQSSQFVEAVVGDGGVMRRAERGAVIGLLVSHHVGVSQRGLPAPAVPERGVGSVAGQGVATGDRAQLGRPSKNQPPLEENQSARSYPRPIKVTISSPGNFVKIGVLDGEFFVRTRLTVRGIELLLPPAAAETAPSFSPPGGVQERKHLFRRGRRIARATPDRVAPLRPFRHTESSSNITINIMWPILKRK